MTDFDQDDDGMRSGTRGGGCAVENKSAEKPSSQQKDLFF